ncbi:hypothetical protein [Nocardia otitidiscaviarum]|uniref:hypothetical protein n=1 Tax=Nocardia otitidiscaviarum TaxID=1823 RepID=UPI002456CCA6|nr:hypothetical protein [Nocardia otitidiscaviarum]
MADLAPLKYGKVVGRFLANVIDGPDLGDHPEFLPLTGTITFAADAPKVLVADAEPAPATYVQLPKHYECQLDEFGYLTWRGGRGVRLVAPNDATNPKDWTWRVSFDLSYDGERVPLESFSFTVPEYIPGPDPEDPDTGSSGLVDLTLAAPVPATHGTGVVVGPRGSGIQIDGQVATYADLPASPDDGSQYVVKSDGLLYVFHTATGGWPTAGEGIIIRGPAGPSNWADITGKPATFPPAIGSTSTTAVAGDDPRLSNARPPTSHTHGAAQISDSTSLGRSLVTVADPVAARELIGAVAGDDPRLSDVRTPTAAGQAYDIVFKSHAGNREIGAGNVMPEGMRIERPITVSSVTYRCETAGTGDLAVQLRRNGTAVAGTSATIAAGSHISDTTVTGTWAFGAGDRITVHITTVDSPAGRGLQASLKAVTS